VISSFDRIELRLEKIESALEKMARGDRSKEKREVRDGVTYIIHNPEPYLSDPLEREAEDYYPACINRIAREYEGKLPKFKLHVRSDDYYEFLREDGLSFVMPMYHASPGMTLPEEYITSRLLNFLRL